MVGLSESFVKIEPLGCKSAPNIEESSRASADGLS